MKIHSDHYEFLMAQINQAWPREKLEEHILKVLKDTRVKDFEKRLRWDLLYGAVPSKWICDSLYPYMNDEHIDSALRHIVKALQLDLTKMEGSKSYDCIQRKEI